VALFLLYQSRPAAVDTETLQPTLNAASTRSAEEVVSLALSLSQTPEYSVLTSAAPTLALIGQEEIRQYAAAAQADSERQDIQWSAAQAAGPPNTETCLDSPTAWASLEPNSRLTLRTYFAELVVPTGVIVYQTFNPGFIEQVVIVDVYGEPHIVYSAVPQPQAICPFPLVIPVAGANYPANTVVVILDQTTSLLGSSQIDAVEMIGVDY
jgi:hypothetical protein